MYQEEMSLGKWVTTQRESHSNNKLQLDRKVLLDEIGFAWNVNQTWHQQYEKLVEFKQKNGHCLVPNRYQEDWSLGKWVATQRARHVRQDRKELLDEIGFAWRVSRDNYKRKADKIWHPQYEKLVEFKQTRVSTRDNYKTKTDKTWHQQYEKLVEFKQTNGNCLVPQSYEGDASLGVWVFTQRASYANNKMRQDRKDLLDELGFTWRVRTAGADNKKHDKYCHQQYGKLLEVKQTNGNALAARSSTTDDSDSEASISSVGLPNETQEETEPGNGHVRNRFASPSPNVKRPRTCLAESAQISATTNPRGGAICSRSSVEKDGGLDEEDSKPSLVASSSALIASYPDQEVVQEEAHTHYEIPSGWKHVKLEPDC